MDSKVGNFLEQGLKRAIRAVQDTSDNIDQQLRLQTTKSSAPITSSAQHKYRAKPSTFLGLSSHPHTEEFATRPQPRSLALPPAIVRAIECANKGRCARCEGQGVKSLEGVIAAVCDSSDETVTTTKARNRRAVLFERPKELDDQLGWLPSTPKCDGSDDGSCNESPREDKSSEEAEADEGSGINITDAMMQIINEAEANVDMHDNTTDSMSKITEPSPPVPERSIFRVLNGSE